MKDPASKAFNPSGNSLVASIKDAADEFYKLLDQLPEVSERRKAFAKTNVETAQMYAVKAVFYDDEDEAIVG